MLNKFVDSLIEINNAIWNCKDDGLDAAAAEERRLWYGWLFEGCHAEITIPLWESAYVGEKDVLLNKDTLEVLKCYYAENLEIDRSFHQPADYIGFEMEFFIELLQINEINKALSFYQEHLRILMKAVFESVNEAIAAYGGEGYYQEIAGKALKLIEKLDECQGEIREAHFNKKLEIKHFIEVSDSYIEEQLKAKEVKSAGRGNCGGRCSFSVGTAAGCVLDIHSCDQRHEPLTAPLCVKGKNYRGTYLTPARLRYPMLRVGKRGEGKFERISWEKAINIMAEKITNYTEKYGPGCRYVNYASGVESVISGDYVLRKMFGLSGGCLRHFNTYSSACIFYTLPYVYGTDVTGSSLASFEDTKLAIFWGNNPLVTEHCDEWLSLIKKLKEKNVKTILIDPHFNETGKALDAEWIPIRPDTDSALAAAMAYVLWEKNLCNQEFMDKYCLGFDKEHMPEGMENEESYKDYIYGLKDGVEKNPEWAEKITGIPKEKIEYLAEAFADGPAAILAGRGCQRNASGEQNVRSITALTCMMGYVGVRGAGSGYNCEAKRHKTPAFDHRINPYKGEIPAFMWTDAILDGKNMTKEKDHIQGLEKLESDIKILFNLDSNTLMNQHSDLNRTAEILKDESKCEFIVVSDVFMTASAKYADLLLPGTSLFEDEYISRPWGEGNYLLYGNRCIEPLFESRFEVDWIMELAEKLGIQDLSEGCNSVFEWNKLLYNRAREIEKELPDFDSFRENGGYRYKNNEISIAFEKEVNDSENNKFPTESGKIEIFSKQLWNYHDEEIPAIPKFIKAFEGVNDSLIEKYPYQLVGWHTKRRTHSIGDNNKKLEKVEPHRLWISSADAAAKGIQDETLVEVFNDRGVVRVKVKVTDDLMPGVLGIPQGAWYIIDKDGVDIRGNVNTLTTSMPTALAKANPQHSCLVDIRVLK